MIILAIDSSGQVAGSALLNDKKVIASITLDDKMTHSQTLMPLIDKLYKMTDINIKDTDFIAVSAGPGSFTGLRIGVATAIGLARGSGAKCVGVSTLKALAYNVYTDAYICPIMDARRNQVYTAVYKREKKRIKEIISPRAISIEELIDILDSYKDVVVIGDGIETYKEYLNKENINIAPLHLRKQNPSSIGVCAYEDISNETIDELKIEYLRKSQAEREREEKNAKNQRS